MIGATQDFLTGAYLITQKDHFMTREKFCQLVNSFLVDEDATMKIDIPKPAIVKVSHAVDYYCLGDNIFNFQPLELWTGKQLFSMILRPNKKCPVKCNLRAKTKPYKGNEEEMTYDDSCMHYYSLFVLNKHLFLPPDVVIRNSELLAGALDKSLLGSGGKGNVFYVLLRDWGENVSIKAMARLARLASNFLMNRGFSIGIEDVMPDVHLVNTKKQLVTEK
jgi:DNA-directed RNA polymerase III subunit RPC1